MKILDIIVDIHINLHFSIELVNKIKKKLTEESHKMINHVLEIPNDS
jgi:hypothetical protein